MVMFLFELFVFLFSVVIHEVSHGFVAERLGDPTARRLGRLTLNPVSHIDPIGSVALPLLMALPALFGGTPIIFGWAKPVPYDPSYLKNPKAGGGIIAAAGPVSNLLIAAIFGILLRNLAYFPISPTSQLPVLFALIIYINILLAIFNLVPIPPLDGSKVLFAVLPYHSAAYRFLSSLEQWGFFLVLAFIFLGGMTFVQPLISWLFTLFVGMPSGL
jgi:Zn-dependent protease